MISTLESLTKRASSSFCSWRERYWTVESKWKISLTNILITSSIKQSLLPRLESFLRIWSETSTYQTKSKLRLPLLKLTGNYGLRLLERHLLTLNSKRTLPLSLLSHLLKNMLMAKKLHKRRLKLSRLGLLELDVSLFKRSRTWDKQRQICQLNRRKSLKISSLR